MRCPSRRQRRRSWLGKPVSRNHWALALLAAASALVYGLAFTRPYSLVALSGQPLYTLAQRALADPYAYARLALAFALLGLLYGLGWRLARRTGGAAAWAIVAGGAVASAAVLLWMYPIGAADLFADIMYGRILSLYHANPYFDVAEAFAGDRFLPYVAWRDTPAHYGPLCLELFAAAARLAGDGVVANALAFKLLNALFLAGSIALVALTLRRTAPEWALAGTLALAWNPIVLYETLANGHNDILMVFWVLAAIWCCTGRRYVLAALALAAAALVKIVPALLVPALAVVALGGARPARVRARFLLGAVVGSLAVTALAYAPLWRGPATLTFVQRQAMFTTSLPAALWAWLGPRWGIERAGAAIGALAWGAAGAFALWRAWRTLRDPSWLSFPRAAFDILLFYLLVACPWYKEWYSIWPLAVAAAIPTGRALVPAVLLNYAGLAQPLIFWPLWFGRAPAPDTVRELYLGPAVMALPLAFLGLRWLRERWPARFGAGPGEPQRLDE